jgi:hypothetical protein
LAGQPFLDSAPHPAFIFMGQSAVEGIDFEPLHVNGLALRVVFDG